MPGIKNRGTKVHKVDTRYNRKKKKKSLDDELFFEEEQENYTASGGVVDFNHTYSLPPLVARFIGDM